MPMTTKIEFKECLKGNMIMSRRDAVTAMDLLGLQQLLGMLSFMPFNTTRQSL